MNEQASRKRGRRRRPPTAAPLEAARGWGMVEYALAPIDRAGFTKLRYGGQDRLPLPQSPYQRIVYGNDAASRFGTR